MDELKIVVTSMLEADEEASAQRIAAQLPAISNRVNAKSSVKIGVEMDERTVQAQAQRITQTLNRSLTEHKVGVNLTLNADTIQEIKRGLNDLGINPNLTREFVKELNEAFVKINSISHEVARLKDGSEQLMRVVVQGEDALGRVHTVSKDVAEANWRSVEEIVKITDNIKKQEDVRTRAAARERADNEARIAALERYKSVLADVQASYSGKTNAKGILDPTHLQELNAAYRSVMGEIKGLESANGALSKTQKAAVESQISDLKRLVAEYRNAEYAATQLRTKNVSSVKEDQIAKLNKFEQELRTAGVLTNSFKKGIEHLRERIAKAFDVNGITLFLNKFDSIQNHAATLIAKISHINQMWKELAGVSGEITDIQKRMAGLDPNKDAGKITALERQLDLYRQQRAEIERQIQEYGSLNMLAQNRIGYEQQSKILEGELAITEAEIADIAAQIDVNMRGIPTSVEAIRARFGQLVHPTQELINSIERLDAEMRAVSDASEDKEKIAAYEKLRETLSFCSEEITKLSVAQRIDIIDAKFGANLEKAKADLATIGRTWSAFKNNKGLNAQFDELQHRLEKINNQPGLTKWTAEFNKFKSEVKAAGLNIQSLGDILKNNIGKVFQWISATTMLFRTFRLLKSGVATVIDLNTALIDLRKVTNATKKEYDEFYHSANETAKAMNATTEAVILQTAEWARLGYSMRDAAELAKNSMIFAAVSPGMEQAAATDGLVSIIKAYGFQVEDTLDGIISKVNEVGNKFAVSNADIVDALTRSSSAMAAANNTFEETVALATAAIEITRNADTVGNALKTLSMRIRGYDEETEEYSEDIAVLTGKIADYTRVASNPKGVTLFTDETRQTYRSTYQILSDIADIWDEIADVDRARVLENLFGKRQAQVGAAILSNFEQARKSIDVMANSAGSADAEMAKVMDSLDARLNRLKETWTGVAQNLFNQEDIKTVISFLTFLSEIIDGLTSKLGLFGTAGIATAIMYLTKFKNAVGELKMTSFIAPTYIPVATRNESAA